MNIPYLVKCLETDKLSDLVAVLDLPPIDLNLSLDDAVAAGEIKIDRANDKVEVLIEDVQPYCDQELANKLLRTIQHYAENETNISRGRMNALMKDPVTQVGYPAHEYIMSMQSLIDSGQVVEDIVDVVKSKKYPAHKFVFLGLPENAENNAEWNAKSVNNWIASFKKVK